MMKILNLYAGIGGNRKLWGNEHDITAIEINPEIAKIYQDFFPNDKVIVTDAHEYLPQHFKEYDFIWSSPPCPTHSRMMFNRKKKLYFDMSLYQEIIFLKYFFKGKWVVENVIPYYNPFIEPLIKIGRHVFWANFNIKPYKFNSEVIRRATKESLSKHHGIPLWKGKNHRLLLRNCVNPKIAKHILNEIR